MCHLKALEKKGIITREPGMSRAIQIVDGFAEEKGLPMRARIAAVSCTKRSSKKNASISRRCLARRIFLC